MSERRVITFHYTLWNQAGEVIDKSEAGEPLAYLEGAGQIIEGLERAIALMAIGQKKKVSVVAKDAYGEKDASLVFRVPVVQFPKKDIKIGDVFQSNDKEDSAIYTVSAVHTEHVELDGNHPLAGQDLTFEVEIATIRPATAQELQHGHAHGGHGHNH